MGYLLGKIKMYLLQFINSPTKRQYNKQRNQVILKQPIGKLFNYCYNLLFDLNPTPIVALNRAIALGYTEGSSKGIAALKSLTGLEQNPFYHTALGNFLQKNGDSKAALEAYQTALHWTHLESGKRLIALKIKQL